MTGNVWDREGAVCGIILDDVAVTMYGIPNGVHASAMRSGNSGSIEAMRTKSKGIGEIVGVRGPALLAGESAMLGEERGGMEPEIESVGDSQIGMAGVSNADGERARLTEGGGCAGVCEAGTEDEHMSGVVASGKCQGEAETSGTLPMSRSQASKSARSNNRAWLVSEQEGPNVPSITGTVVPCRGRSGGGVVWMA